jgi:predicted ATP-grasp superfamily ATP-dependent carboligase
MASDSTDDPTFEELWEGLSKNQRRYVLARKEHSNKADAAQAIGLTADTVYRWPSKVDTAVDMLLTKAAANARSMLEQAVVKAAATKIEGLGSSNEWVQQTAAKEILDRVLGKAIERKQIDDQPKKQVTFSLPSNGREGDGDDD